MKTVEASYIESGTFQASEEHASAAGIEPGETVVILREADAANYKAFVADAHKKLTSAAGRRNWRGLKQWERDLLKAASGLLTTKAHADGR